VNRAPAGVLGWLIIDIKAARPHRDKDVSGAGHVAVEKHFDFQMPAPPLYCRFDIGSEHMSMMKVDRHILVLSAVETAAVPISTPSLQGVNCPEFSGGYFC
jgi:hypothetical protein